MRFTSASCLALLALLAGCGDKGSVSLTPYLEEATVAVQSDSFFGPSVDGSFWLELSLGAEASGPSTVDLGNFSLLSEARVPLIDVLSLESAATPPFQIKQGSVERIQFTFHHGSVERDVLCEGQLRIVGSVIDSLKGGTAPVESALITPDCNPPPAT